MQIIITPTPGAIAFTGTLKGPCVIVGVELDKADDVVVKVRTCGLELDALTDVAVVLAAALEELLEQQPDALTAASTIVVDVPEAKGVPA